MFASQEREYTPTVPIQPKPPQNPPKQICQDTVSPSKDPSERSALQARAPDLEFNPLAGLPVDTP